MKKRSTEIKNIRNTNLRLNMDIPIQQKAWAYLQEMDKKIYRSYSNIISHAIVEYFDRQKQIQKGDLTEKDQYFLQQIQLIVQKEIKEIIECNHIKMTIDQKKDSKQGQELIFQNKIDPISTEQFQTEYEVNDTALDFIEGFGGED